jgi:hypothetical protein
VCATIPANCKFGSQPQGKFGSQPQVEVISSFKSPTTEDVTTGICKAIDGVLEKSTIEVSDILSVNIGTTHFVNAIVQSDRSKLARVAVLRLCGPFCREVPPFADFPMHLRDVIEGPVGYLSGGLESKCIQCYKLQVFH